jgi:DNA-binding CsgD family transcriptional regulator
VALTRAWTLARGLGVGLLVAEIDALGWRARIGLARPEAAPDGLAQAPTAPPDEFGLTPRELEVLRLLVEGRSNRQIAEQLFISGKTVSVHVTNILAKLGVHSRLEAAAMARRLGLDQSAQEGADSAIRPPQPTTVSMAVGLPQRAKRQATRPHRTNGRSNERGKEVAAIGWMPAVTSSLRIADPTTARTAGGVVTGVVDKRAPIQNLVLSAHSGQMGGVSPDVVSGDTGSNLRPDCDQAMGDGRGQAPDSHQRHSR